MPTELLTILSSRFAVLHERSVDVLARVSDDHLFWRPEPIGSAGEPYPIGELLVRSAAAVEQVCGGISRRLWDDPFEWTLPEELSDKTRIREYLDEVEQTRINTFKAFAGDDDLFRSIPAPAKLTPIAEVLVAAIDRSSNLQGRAIGVAQQFLRFRPLVR